MSTDSSVRMTIRNDRADLPKLQEALERFGEQHGVSSKALNQLRVVLDELASNIIKYAWPGGGAHELSVSFGIGNGAVRLEIMDDGAAFNPLDTPPPVPLRPGQRRRPGGVGIHMVRQLVDAIEYGRIGARNRVTITKHIT